jgi:alpha-methylacyl-CoA racemase
MTGWGQQGPWAQTAGHDINYISITGALHAIGANNGPPVPPLNLVGDYAGGSLYLLVGILAALLESKKSGQGQVVDAAIADGVISLMSHFFGGLAAGDFVERRASNMLDGGTPYYDVYETLDGKYLSVGALEPKFFKVLSGIIQLSDEMIMAHSNPEMWPNLRLEFKAIFKTKTRDQWMQLFDETDACVAPVLSLSEADLHAHNQYRKSIVTIDGVKQPSPAPRFSRTPSAIQSELSGKFSDIDQLISEWH